MRATDRSCPLTGMTLKKQPVSVFWININDGLRELKGGRVDKKKSSPSHFTTNEKEKKNKKKKKAGLEIPCKVKKKLFRTM